MPKIAKELSAIEIKRIEKLGLNAVGGVTGLHLQVYGLAESADKAHQNKRIAKSWILRVKIGKHRRDVGLGAYPEVSLAIARQRAIEAKEMIAKGIDPVEQKRMLKAQLLANQALIMSFDEAAELVHIKKSNEFSNSKYAAQWISQIKMYASPFIGKMQIKDIELIHVLQVLEPIWLTKNQTAKKVRGNLEAIFAWASIKGYRKGENPARWQGYLDAILEKPHKVHEVENHPALPFDEMGSFIIALRKQKGAAAKMLEFAILTGGRTGEVVGAKWSEFNLAEKLWLVPKERMGKTGREHRVALSKNAIKLLESTPVHPDSELVFPTPRNHKSEMSNNAMRKLVQDMHKSEVDAGRKGWVDPKIRERIVVPHGFRSSFSDWTSEKTNHSFEVREMALSHTVSNSTEAAYRRGDLFEKRVELVQDWADFINGIKKTAVVIDINKKSA